jgi:hypothetical protein
VGTVVERLDDDLFGVESAMTKGGRAPTLL